MTLHYIHNKTEYKYNKGASFKHFRICLSKSCSLMHNEDSVKRDTYIFMNRYEQRMSTLALNARVFITMKEIRPKSNTGVL